VYKTIPGGKKWKKTINKSLNPAQGVRIKSA
jgi:hypothetical protein